MSPYPADRAQLFDYFAVHECAHDPLYVALCRLLAQRPAALALLDAAPRTQQRPNLLLAAIHERVLAGQGGALAAYFPSAGSGDRPPDAALPAALDELLADQASALLTHCATRTTQTNEIGRCAVLWPALAEIAAQAAGRPLALLDFGCSAGLNLGVDRYRYRYGDSVLGAPAGPQTPEVACHPVAGRAPPMHRAAPVIAQRLGLDPAPIDLRDDVQARWLSACLWPYDAERRTRLAQAAAIQRQHAWPVRQVTDCLAAIEPWLGGLPAGVQPVVFNSWVLAYFDREALAAHVAAMRGLVERHGIAWLSAEGRTLQLGDVPPPGEGDDQVDGAALANGTLWFLTRPGGCRLLARSHPHGRWVDWRAG